MPSLDVWDILLKPGYRAKLHEDNQPTKRIIERQQNPTMRHLSRSHGISIRWLHDLFSANDAEGNCVDPLYGTPNMLARQ